MSAFCVNGMKSKGCRKTLAQVTIEVSVAFFIIFMLFMLTAKLFNWFANSMMDRQMTYELTRKTSPKYEHENVAPGNVYDMDKMFTNTGLPVDYDPLDLVEDETGD